MTVQSGRAKAGACVVAWLLAAAFCAIAWGQDDGPRLVKNINPVGSSWPFRLVELNGVALFAADDGTLGYELWRSDGTESGTYLVKDINPVAGKGGLWSLLLKVVGDQVFLIGYTEQHGYALWKTDGTESGTVLVKDIHPGEGTFGVASQHVSFDGQLFFVGDDQVHGRELWKSDGTPAGTVLVKDILPGPASGIGWDVLGRDLMEVSGSLYLIASAPETGVALWKSDGTAEGTVLVKDVVPGDVWDGWVTSFGAASGKVYFGVNEKIYSSEPPSLRLSTQLWTSDGTESGTLLVKELYSTGPGAFWTPYNFEEVGGTLLFMTTEGGFYGPHDLWKTDGTAEGTVLLKEFNKNLDWAHSGFFLTALGDTLLFAAGDQTAGMELWRSDGTPEGTVLVRDINPGPNSSIYSGVYSAPPIAVVDSTVYFNAVTDDLGSELWKTDGTAEGTELVADIAPGPAWGVQWVIGQVGRSVYLRGNNGDGDVELWTHTPIADTDGDGLSDEWETDGYTHDNGEFVDLPAMGADPMRKDVFVQIDYMAGRQPMSSALQKVVAAFANAPVSNPDGSTGITLHINLDEQLELLEELGTLGEGNVYVWTRPDGSPVTHFDDLKADHFPEELGSAVHYCIWANKIPGQNAGMSRGIEAGDFIVSLGDWIEQAGQSEESWEAGTFMHELGHNLGLGHGGGDDVNFKPNYLSIMNYAFQMDGLMYGGELEHFDYSGTGLDPLDEYALDESQGLTPAGDVAGYGTTWWWFMLWDGNPQNVQHWAEDAAAPINWRVVEYGEPEGDINQDSAYGTLTSFDDWSNLVFTGGSVGAGIPIPPPAATPAEELDLPTALTLMTPAPVTKLNGHTADGNLLHLTWKPAGPQKKIREYRIYRDGTKIGTSATTEFKDPNVEAGVSYTYFVTWVNLLSQESVASEEVVLELR